MLLNIPGIILVVLNVIISYMGFKDRRLFDRYAFDVDAILIRKEYHRMLTSGFLHVGWNHLIFNMISLYLFSDDLVLYTGYAGYFLIYFGSLLGGNLLALWMHRKHGDYRAVGASGAISGLIFATVLFSPGILIGFYFIPPIIPGWIYGAAYVLYSIYGIRNKRDNIGHEAHLGGLITGMMLALCLDTTLFARSYTVLVTTLLPALIFLYLVYKYPHFSNKVTLDLPPSDPTRNYTVEDRYNTERLKKQQKLDQILEKIQRKGLDSLSKEEKAFLDDNSR